MVVNRYLGGSQKYLAVVSIYLDESQLLLGWYSQLVLARYLVSRDLSTCKQIPRWWPLCSWVVVSVSNWKPADTLVGWVAQTAGLLALGQQIPRPDVPARIFRK